MNPMKEQTKKKKDRPERQPEAKAGIEPSLQKNGVTPDVSTTPFIKALGSTDFATRAKGVAALTRFLQVKQDLAEGDLLKIWKGLYVCFWHSDKPHVQADLADRLVGVFPNLSQRMAYQYFTLFIRTMQREWFTIDRLRLDKFLMLVRKFLGQVLAYLRSHNWDDALMSQYTDFLRDQVLMPREPVAAMGLAYHICDVFVSELRDCVSEAAPTATSISHPNDQQQQQQQQQGALSGKKRAREQQHLQQQQQQGALPATAFEALLEPFSTTLLRAPEQAMLTRVRESVFDPLIEELQEDGQPEHGEDESEDEDEEGGGPSRPPVPLLLLAGGEELCSSLAEQLFALGSIPEVKARNRVMLCGVAQALEKAQRKRAKRVLTDTASSPSPAPQPSSSTPLSLPRHQQQQAQKQAQAEQQMAQRAEQLARVREAQAAQKQAKHEQKKSERAAKKAYFAALEASEDEPPTLQPLDAGASKSKSQHSERSPSPAPLDPLSSSSPHSGSSPSASASPSASPSPLPISPTSVAAMSLKALKKLRKAQAAAAAAAAWGEGGIGANAGKRSASPVSDQDAHASSGKAAAEGAPPVSGKKEKKQGSSKGEGSNAAASNDGGFAFAFPLPAKVGSSNAEGSTGEGQSPSTPTLGGKSAAKKDRKRKAQDAGVAGTPGSNADGEDGLVELGSVSKSALKTAAKRQQSSLQGSATASTPQEGNSSGVQLPGLATGSTKKQRRLQQQQQEPQQQQGQDRIGLQESPEQPPSASKSLLKSALQQQLQQQQHLQQAMASATTPSTTPKSALKQKQKPATIPADGAGAADSDGALGVGAVGVSPALASASKKALKSAMKHRSVAAPEEPLSTGLPSTTKAALKASAAKAQPSVNADGDTLISHEGPGNQGAAAAETPTVTPRRSKRARMQEQQQQQQTPPENGFGLQQQEKAPDTTPQAQSTAAGTTRSNDSSGKKKAGAAGNAPNTSVRKAVRINLRKNLVFEHGAPVPDPMVRTPPTARSKGGILKRAQESLAAMGISSSLKSAPAKLEKAQARQQAQKQGAGSAAKPNKLARSTHTTPLKSPRAKAALFF